MLSPQEQQASKAMAVALKYINDFNSTHKGNFSTFNYTSFSLATFGRVVPLPTAQGSAATAGNITASNSCSGTRCSRYRQWRTSANGCTWSPDYIFKGCCDGHDHCYGTCNQARSSCDSSFHRCMQSTCSRQSFWNRPFCSNTANAYFAFVSAFGCSFYQGAQRSSCSCA